MASPANELQALIVTILKADGAVAALVADAIFDRVPEARKDSYPRLTIGPASEVDESDGCIAAAEHDLQLDIWSQKAGGFKEAKEIGNAIKRALIDQDFDLPTHATFRLEVPGRRYVRDPDGITSHGIIRVTARIEENG